MGCRKHTVRFQKAPFISVYTNIVTLCIVVGVRGQHRPGDGGSPVAQFARSGSVLQAQPQDMEWTHCLEDGAVRQTAWYV